MTDRSTITIPPSRHVAPALLVGLCLLTAGCLGLGSTDNTQPTTTMADDTRPGAGPADEPGSGGNTETDVPTQTPDPTPTPTPTATPEPTPEEVIRTDDKDGIPDSWEAQGETPSGIQIPNASADKRDFYVHVVRGPNTELDEEWWAEYEQKLESRDRFPIDNLHITLDHDRVIDLEGGYPPAIQLQEKHGDLYPEDEDFTRLLLISKQEEKGFNTELQGFARGNIAASGSQTTWTVTHELFHTIVGELPPEDQCVPNDKFHTCSGFLEAHSWSVSGETSNVTIEYINEHGIPMEQSP